MRSHGGGSIFLPIFIRIAAQDRSSWSHFAKQKFQGMEEINIRRAVEADLEHLLRFEQEIIRTERPYDNTLKRSEIHYYDIGAMIRDPDSEVLVVQVGERIIGSGYAHIEQSKPYLEHAMHAYLGFMYVEPAHRGKSINRQMIDALRHWAASRKVTEFRLDVYAENLTAIRAYEKAGFSPHLIEMRMAV